MSKKHNKGRFTNKYKWISLFMLVMVSFLTFAFLSGPSVTAPKMPSEYENTAVMLLNPGRTGGGSGVVLESKPHQSLILTNAHVCKAVTAEGLVLKFNKPHLITGIKVSKEHDLCLVKVNSDLGVNTRLADSPPKRGSKAFISGHPQLLPHVLSEGQFSGRIIISIATDLRPCVEEDFNSHPLECVLLGVIPVIKTFDSQLVSSLTAPGSSGSAVFNEDGEISGLVFAGQGDGLSYSMIVPWEYLYEFLNHEAHKMIWSKL